eukprot:m.48819 g.48819  ORF g.48819 m.48819 type:complete len:145 (-) comp15969_c0_seq4:2207-2641(-)
MHLDSWAECRNHLAQCTNYRDGPSENCFTFGRICFLCTQKDSPKSVQANPFVFPGVQRHTAQPILSECRHGGGQVTALNLYAWCAECDLDHLGVQESLWQRGRIVGMCTIRCVRDDRRLSVEGIPMHPHRLTVSNQIGTAAVSR